MRGLARAGIPKDNDAAPAHGLSPFKSLGQGDIVTCAGVAQLLLGIFGIGKAGSAGGPQIHHGP